MALPKRVLRTRSSLLTAALAVALLAPFAAQAQRLEGGDCTPGPGDRPETGLNGSVPASERQGPEGFKGFWCGVRKIGQHSLYNRGSFGDLQIIVDDRGHCAYASMRDPSNLNLGTTGTVVLDVSVPSRPKDVRVLRSPAMLRSYSGFEMPVSQETRRPGNIMIAGFKDFGPNGTNPIDIYDTSGPNCLEVPMLSTTDLGTGRGHHDGWVSADAKTWYGIPFGGPDIRLDPTRVDIHITDISDPRNPKLIMDWNRLQLPPEIYAQTNATRNFHDVTSNADGSRVYMALYGAGSCANGLLIMDSTDIALRRPNPQLKYVRFLSWCEQQIDPDFGDGSSASTHATEWFIHENGRQYVMTTDEGSALGGSACPTQTTFSRLIDISDELNPVIVATMKPDASKGSNCAINQAMGNINGMLHYLNFDDRYNARLAMVAASNQGIRVYDLADPYEPKQVAYYHKEDHIAAKQPQANLFPNYQNGSPECEGQGDRCDTVFPNATDFTRPDPRFDSENCFWYTGWNQGGLVIIELTNPEYNACMRKNVKAKGKFVDPVKGRRKVDFNINAKRSNGGRGALEGSGQLIDSANNVFIQIDTLTLLGGVRDDCAPVTGRASAVQIEGTGTYNGRNASFRVCVQEASAEGFRNHAERFHLACTAGCAYETGGELTSGNVQVKPRD
jgi:hypothetical protein